MQFPVQERAQIPARACDTCCREEMATMLLLLPSVPDNLTAKHVRNTPKARQDEYRFQCAQLYNSCGELNSVLALPHLAVCVDGCPCPACSWAHQPCGVRGWLIILKLKASFDVMTLKPSTVNSKFCTIATNQLFHKSTLIC